MIKFNPAQIEAFTGDWASGLMIAEICQRHTLSRDQVIRLRIRLELPPRLDRRARRTKQEQETPTKEEIERRAAEIRAGWSADVERKRRGIPDDYCYEIPQGLETPQDFDPQWYEGG